MSERKRLPGKFVWFELRTADSRRAQAFYGEVLRWKTVPWQAGPATYDMIFTGDTPDTMIGGYAAAPAGSPARWLSFVSVADVDGAAGAAIAAGGRVVQAPFDAPGAGRMTLIADAQGAEIHLMTRINDDPPDHQPPPAGRFIWNELHTTDPTAALAFYGKVVGYSHRSQDTGGPGGTYHIISAGGIDRGGITHHLPRGQAPHWLPYVKVDAADDAAARATRAGGDVLFGPENIPNAGRAAVLRDPTGASFAIVEPQPPSAS